MELESDLKVTYLGQAVSGPNEADAIGRLVRLSSITYGSAETIAELAGPGTLPPEVREAVAAFLAVSELSSLEAQELSDSAAYPCRPRS